MRVIAEKYLNNEEIVVSVFGTSIAQGFYATGYENIDRDGNFQITWTGQYDDSVRGWLVQAREFLKAKNAASDIYNVSVGGGTIQDQLDFDNVGLLNTKTPKTDMAIIACQVNDAISATKWVGIPEYKRNLRELINTCRASNMKVAVMLENDIDSSRYADNRTDGKTYADIVQAARTVASQYVVPVWDVYTPWNKILIASGGAIESGLHHDTVHPNQDGHDLLYQKFQNFMDGLVFHQKHKHIHTRAISPRVIYT